MPNIFNGISSYTRVSLERPYSSSINYKMSAQLRSSGSPKREGERGNSESSDSGKKSAVDVNESDRAKRLSPDEIEAHDDVKLILGTFGALLAGLLAYAILERI